MLGNLISYGLWDGFQVPVKVTKLRRDGLPAELTVTADTARSRKGAVITLEDDFWEGFDKWTPQRKTLDGSRQPCETIGMKIQTIFSPKFAANTPTPSMRKLAPVAAAAAKAGYAQLQEPDLAHQLSIVTRLSALHDPAYVNAFVSGKGRLASSNGFEWSPQLRDGVLAMNAGMLSAVRLAMAHGIAAVTSQGAHHAHPGHGGGFCSFNFLALVAKETPGRRVFVLDMDNHGGDGTAEFAKRLPNLFNYSICGSTFGAEEHSRSVVDPIRLNGDFKPCAAAMKRAFKAAAGFKPGIVIYQAGCDAHESDSLGGANLTTEQIYERDLTVIRHFKSAGIPLVVTLAGGYNPNMDFLVSLHMKAFQAAHKVWN